MTNSRTDIEVLSDLVEKQQTQIEEQQNQIESQAERLQELEDACIIRESRINSITRSLDSVEEDISSLAIGAVFFLRII
jgi:chromosome segregation ATPase